MKLYEIEENDKYYMPVFTTNYQEDRTHNRHIKLNSYLKNGVEVLNLLPSNRYKSPVFKKYTFRIYFNDKQKTNFILDLSKMISGPFVVKAIGLITLPIIARFLVLMHMAISVFLWLFSVLLVLLLL